MTDIRVVRTWEKWGTSQDRVSMTIWIRQPISNIAETELSPDESILSVRTTDGNLVQCDDTPENRKALGMVEAGSPPSILLRHEHLEALRLVALRDSDEASR